MMLRDFVFIFIYFTCINAIIPTGELKIHGTNELIHVAPAYFGPALLQEYETTYYTLLISNTLHSQGCEISVISIVDNLPFYLLVSRGNCTFEEKAMNAQNSGASGIIIYDSLIGIYHNHNYADSDDYNCNDGSAFIDTLIEPIYEQSMIDTIPQSCMSNCPSNQCIVTNITSSNGHKVCCAWDLYLSMGSTSSTDDDYNTPIVSVNIPAVFIRMKDYNKLISDPNLIIGMLQIKIYLRELPFIDFGQLFLWLIAIFTIIYGSIQAASEDTYQNNSNDSIIDVYSDYNNNNNIENQTETSNLLYKNNENIENYINNQLNSTIHIKNPTKHIEKYTENTQKQKENSQKQSENTQKYTENSQKQTENSQKQTENTQNMNESIDITINHSLIFIFLSSFFLILLYFINLYIFIIILYLFASIFTLSKVIILPFLHFIKYKMFPNENPNENIYSNENSNEFFNENLNENINFNEKINENMNEFGSLELFSYFLSAIVSLIWFLYR